MAKYYLWLLLGFSSSLMAAFPLEIQKLAPDVYALVGEMEQRSETNLANNATFGVIVTSEGVILVDPGGSYEGAKQIAETIKTITDQPVRYVINSGGQDHRWLGNDYFQKRGATVIAASAAVADHKARMRDQLLMLQMLIGESGLAGTEPSFADEVFEGEHQITVGGVTIRLIHVGPAHTPADTLVFMPEQGIVFAGDVVYMERMLGVGPMSNSAHWLEAFGVLESLKPKWVVPGHGHASTLEKARSETYDYLLYIREKVGEMLESDIGMEKVGDIDQSDFSHLKVYEQIKGRNAQQVYTEMEWE